MEFKIITAVWNSESFFKGYADSIMSQDDFFDVIVYDDASTDGTSELAEYICDLNFWSFIQGDVNRGVPHAQWAATHAIPHGPEDVFVFVDGDDQLAPDALNRLRRHYEEDPELLLTYGQYRSEPFSPTCSLAGPYPSNVIQRRAYREHSVLGRGIPWNHLRTIRCSLFDQLVENDFKFDNGEWYSMSGDAAVMYPCLELAGDHFKFIEEVLYVYNSENPLSEWRKAPREGDRVHQHVLHRPPKVPVIYDRDPVAKEIRRVRRLREQ